jgi:hypothetical protein
MAGLEHLTEEQRAKGREAKDRARDVKALVQEFRLDETMGSAQLAAIEKRCGDVPVSMRRAYLKAMKGDSPAAGIRAHCRECLGFERDATGCTAPACALFPYRPGADDDA